MAVLLTGGAGFIGSHTALSILESGLDVVVLDNLSNAKPEALRRVEKLTGKKAPLVVGDCTDEAAVPMTELSSDTLLAAMRSRNGTWRSHARTLVPPEVHWADFDTLRWGLRLRTSI